MQILGMICIPVCVQQIEHSGESAGELGNKFFKCCEGRTESVLDSLSLFLSLSLSLSLSLTHTHTPLLKIKDEQKNR
jgi:hypothetical protein